MRKRSHLRLVLIALVALASLVLAITAVLRREPKFEGKTTRQWIYLLDPHVDYSAQHDHASEVISRIGPRAVPVIRDILSEPKIPALQKLKMLAQRYRILEHDPLPLADRQLRASRAAYKVAESGNTDISSLVPLLAFHLTNSSYSNVESGRALAGAGPHGISILTNLASNPDPRFRDRAIVSLQHARSAPGVFDTYLRASSDPEQNIRFSALSSLARYPKAEPNLLIPLALERIQSTNDYDRWAAVQILSTFSFDSRARPALTNALVDSNATVRSIATRALNASRR
jgi:hypothetical protein